MTGQGMPGGGTRPVPGSGSLAEPTARGLHGEKRGRCCPSPGLRSHRSLLPLGLLWQALALSCSPVSNIPMLERLLPLPGIE